MPKVDSVSKASFLADVLRSGFRGLRMRSIHSLWRTCIAFSSRLRVKAAPAKIRPQGIQAPIAMLNAGRLLWRNKNKGLGFRVLLTNGVTPTHKSIDLYRVTKLTGWSGHFAHKNDQALLSETS